MGGAMLVTLTVESYGDRVGTASGSTLGTASDSLPLAGKMSSHMSTTVQVYH